MYKENAFVCNACHVSKIHKLPYSPSIIKVGVPLDIVLLDIWVSSKPSTNGYNYYMHFIYAFSHYTRIYFSKHMFDMTQAFIQFKVQAKLQTRCKIKVLQFDWRISKSH